MKSDEVFKTLLASKYLSYNKYKLYCKGSVGQTSEKKANM